MTYIDIPNRVKSDQSFPKTRPDARVEEVFIKAADNCLGKIEEEAQVRVKKEIVMQCKNIAKVKAMEDIREALEKQFEPLSLQRPGIRKLRKAYEATQTASVYRLKQRSHCLQLLKSNRVEW